MKTNRLLIVCLLLVFPVSIWADLTVQVWPDKLQVRPGEPVQLQVTVNGLAAGQTAAVRCRVLHLLDTEAARFAGTTDAQGKAVFTFRPQAEFGYEAVAEVTAGERQAVAREVFACAKNPWQPAPGYSGSSLRLFNTRPDGPPFGAEETKYLNDWIVTCRDLYIPVTEILSLAPCPFSSMEPLTENYFSGQGATVYKNSVTLLRYLISELHANGVASVAYVNGAVSGVQGTEFARQHPEYLCYLRDGTVYTGGGISTTSLPLLQRFYREYPQSLQDQELMKNLACAEPGGLHIAPVNFNTLATVEWGARQLMKGREIFGYDGVRFDGHYSTTVFGDPLAPVPQILDYQGKPVIGQNADEVSARNMRHAMSMIRAKYPDFLFGFNASCFVADPSPTPKQDAVIAPGNYILDETAKHVDLAPEYRNRWTVYLREMAAQVDRARKAGAFLFAGWGGAMGKQEMAVKYIKAVSWACGARYIADSDSIHPDMTKWRAANPWLHQYHGFAYRYSRFILSDRLQRVPADQAARLVRVNSARPVLYENLVQKLQDDSGRYLIVHLINAPLEERITRSPQTPPPAEGVQVTLASELFAGGKPDPARVAALSPEAAGPAWCDTTTAAGGAVEVKVPAFPVWTILVIPY